MFVCHACGDGFRHVLISTASSSSDATCRCGMSRCRLLDGKDVPIWFFGTERYWLVLDICAIECRPRPEREGFDQVPIPSEDAPFAFRAVICSQVLHS